MDRFLKHINAQRARIRNAISKLEDELQKLEYSEQAYRASGAVTELAGGQKSIVLHGALVPDERTSHRATIKERVITVLLAHPAGLTSSQLLECVRAAGLPKINRQSLGPKLTRLKSDKTLEREHGLWRLKKTEIECG